MHSARFVTVCLLAAGVLGVIACNATPEIPNDVQRRASGNAAEPTTDESNQTSKPADTDAAPPPAPPPPAMDAGATDAAPEAGPPGPQCKNETTQNKCYECCDKAVPAAIKYLQDSFTQCLCAVPGVCKNSCGDNYCQNPNNVSLSCKSCIDANEDFCAGLAYGKCEKDPVCSQLFACDKAAGCADKPKN